MRFAYRDSNSRIIGRSDDMADEIVGIGLRDLDGRKLAGRGDPVVDEQPSIDFGSHTLMAAFQQVFGLSARALDQNLETSANQPSTTLERDGTLSFE